MEVRHQDAGNLPYLAPPTDFLPLSRALGHVFASCSVLCTRYELYVRDEPGMIRSSTAEKCPRNDDLHRSNKLIISSVYYDIQKTRYRHKPALILSKTTGFSLQRLEGSILLQGKGDLRRRKVSLMLASSFVQRKMNAPRQSFDPTR